LLTLSPGGLEKVTLRRTMETHEELDLILKHFYNNRSTREEEGMMVFTINDIIEYAKEYGISTNHAALAVRKLANNDELLKRFPKGTKYKDETISNEETFIITYDGMILYENGGFSEKFKKERRNKIIELIKFWAILIGSCGVLFSIAIRIYQSVESAKQDKLHKRVEQIEQKVKLIETSKSQGR